MTTDGGVEAITGFVFQSIAALLESLESDEWTELAIDPVQADEDCQKVDIEWRLRDGRIRVAQVKHSINGIEVPTAKKWATELKTSRTADEYKLLLYAPTTAGVPGLGRHDDVEIEVKQGDILLLWDALTFRALKYLRGRKQPDAVFAQEAIRLMVGRTITGVTERMTWTHASLEDLLLQLIESFERRRTVEGPTLSVSLLRVIRCATHGRCEEFARYTFRNRTAEPLAMPGWSIKWTDSDGIVIDRVREPPVGGPFYQEWTYDGSDIFELEITPTTVVPPGGVGIIEVHLSQTNLIEPLGNPPVAWTFKDPLLPTDSPHQADVYIIFPRDGSIIASQPSIVCARTAHWEIMTGPLRRLTAVMQANPPSLTANQELLNELEGYFLPGK